MTCTSMLFDISKCYVIKLNCIPFKRENIMQIRYILHDIITIHSCISCFIELTGLSY